MKMAVDTFTEKRQEYTGGPHLLDDVTRSVTAK